VPTIQQQPIDVQWFVLLASAQTPLPGFSALAAAVTLSAANANAPVQVAQVDQVVTAATALQPAQVNMPATGVIEFAVQLQSTGTVYPLETARVAAYALSAANGNAPVNVYRVQAVVTAP
jgi:hypothetical protein